MDLPLDEFDHPAWFTAAGTVIGWGLMIAFVFVLLFLIPFVLWP